MNIRLRTSGFTLLELAIVLVIISLVVGTSMVATIGVLESTKRDVTQKKMDEIEKALMAFRVINNRLPCPSRVTLSATHASYGKEVDLPGYCSGGTISANFIATGPYGGFQPDVYYAAEGGVPVRALNLPDEYMYDGWGRRFAYAVNPMGTFKGGFNYFDYQVDNSQCDLGLFLKDSASGSTIAHPVYVLMSYGPNGHGGWSASSDRVTSNSFNTDEQKNCHCNSALGALAYDATYVSHASTEDPAGGLNYFDDIVRYKERWQLQSYEDQYILNERWPVAALMSTVFQTAPTLEWRSCGIEIGSAPATGTVGATAFVLEYTPNATHLFSVSSTGCQLNKLYYDQTTHTVDISNVSAPPNCPTWDWANRAAISDNGIVAMAKTTSPFIQFWQHSGDQLNYIGDAGLSPVLTVRPMQMVFARNAEFLAASDNSTYIKMFRRKGNGYRFTELSGQPPGGFIPVAMAFSPPTVNGQYFAMARTAPSTIGIWRVNSTGTFTYVRNIDGPATGTIAFIAFSPDGNYIAAGGGDDTTVANEVAMYKIEPENRFTAVTIAGTHYYNAPIMDGGFMSDSRILAVEMSPFSMFINRKDELNFYYYDVSAGSGGGLPMAFR